VINHIDLGTVLRRTVCDLYSDLVTRPTGVAVRCGIERQLEELGHRTLTVIDFSRVGLLDFSCADEIVAKLLLRLGDEPERDAYFLFRGVSDSHQDAIEAVLERYGLAIVAQAPDGAVMLVGAVDDAERRVWEATARLGRAVPADVARETDLAPGVAAALLDTLWRRRLVMRLDDRCYAALGAVAA
jgi:hypothetical protein